MITGNGVLQLRDGGELETNYQFGSSYDDARSGYLLCDAKKLDPAVFGETLNLKCDDGTVLRLAVVHFTDRHLAVVGRVVHKQTAA
jgi:hypothetical protein